MREIPTLFNTPMVQAILDDLKTNTRRPCKGVGNDNCIQLGKLKNHILNERSWVKCPFGGVGDILAVRESARVLHYNSSSRWMDVEYVADGTQVTVPWPERMKWKPVIGHCIPNGCHLEAIRIKLTNKRVWVERVQDISEADAIAEGIERVKDNMPPYAYFGWRDYSSSDELPFDSDKPIASFKSLWNSIYGSWERNDWVWCSEFERIKTK